MITTREALPADAAFIAHHAYRLLDFKLPKWREHEKTEMVQADIHHITRALEAADPNDCVFMAEDETSKPIGFLRMVIVTDYYTGEQHAHVKCILW